MHIILSSSEPALDRFTKLILLPALDMHSIVNTALTTTAWD
jgi:hypothetical protein